MFSQAAPYSFGNVGPVLPDVRSDWTRNIDTVLVKDFGFDLYDHRLTTQFRFEVYNLFNTPQFAAPNNTVGSQTFGEVTSMANNPRELQLALKVSF